MGRIDPIKIANSRNLEDFLSGYLPDFDSSGTTTWIHPKSSTQYTITLQTSSQLSPQDLDSCFELIKSTSKQDYEKSKDGWNPRGKRNEMRLDDLKYLLVKYEGTVKGFASMMPTWEDGKPVVYCYEIHLGEELLSTGLGTLLMSYISTVAKNVPAVCKVMLTCFTRNSQAMQFYRKLGFEKDEYSPEPTVLRNGTVVEAAYVILSKGV